MCHVLSLLLLSSLFPTETGLEAVGNAFKELADERDNLVCSSDCEEHFPNGVFEVLFSFQTYLPTSLEPFP